MKVVYKGDGRIVVEGMHIATLPAERCISQSDMKLYYKLEPDNKAYRGISSPSSYDRLVIRRPNGNIVIVPNRTDLYHFS